MTPLVEEVPVYCVVCLSVEGGAGTGWTPKRRLHKDGGPEGAPLPLAGDWSPALRPSGVSNVENSLLIHSSILLFAFIFLN